MPRLHVSVKLSDHIFSFVSSILFVEGGILEDGSGIFAPVNKEGKKIFILKIITMKNSLKLFHRSDFSNKYLT